MVKPSHYRATRADVAREAGTSVAVVSYVVNNGPRPVAAATRERVIAAIKKTGYRPNNVARALASGMTKTYGLVVPNISNPFIASLAHALQQEALDNDMVMLLGDAGDCRQRERQLLNNMLSQQVNGLLYVSVDRRPYIDLLRASGTPFVLIDQIDASAHQVNVLWVDECEASRRVTAHLLSHGYQDIGIICGPLDRLNTQERLQGWRQALAEYQLAERPEWIISTPYTFAGGYQAAMRMIQQKSLPRALFATNEAQAIGCIRGLAQQGVRVPEDLALVCFNGTEQSAYHVPSLTTVRQPVRAIAKSALKMLAGWKNGTAVCEFSHHLVQGESCGCPTASNSEYGNETTNY